MNPGGHGEDFRTNRPSTLNIGRSVSNHPDTVRLQGSVEMSIGCRMCEPGDVVPVGMVVTIATKLEVMEQVIMLEFHPSPAFQISGKQSQHNVVARAEFPEQF